MSPSLPGPRLMIFYRDAWKFSILTPRQPMIDVGLLTLIQILLFTRIDLTTSALVGARVYY